MIFYILSLVFNPFLIACDDYFMKRFDFVGFIDGYSAKKIFLSHIIHVTAKHRASFSDWLLLKDSKLSQD